MSKKDEEIEIDITDGALPATKAEEVEVVVEETPKARETASAREREVPIEEGIEALKARLEDERKARMEAEKRAREAQEQAFRAYTEVETNERALVNNAITSLRRDQDVLKAQLREVMSIGDYDVAADIQLRMSRNEAELMQLEHGFREMQNKPQPRMPEQAPQYEVDMLINNVTPRSAEWLRRNRETLLDGRNVRVMRRAHEDAVDYGMIPESDEYFRFVEKRLNLNSEPSRYAAEEESVYSAASAPVQRRSAPPAAPVSRSAPTNSGPRPGTIRLNSDQVEAAKISGLTPKEYYEQMVREEKRKSMN
jgi:hypothetical protein